MSLVDVDYGKNRCCKYEILRFYQTLFCDNFMYTFIHFNFIFTSSCSGCLVEDISFSSFFFSLEREEHYGIFRSVRKNISKL